MAGTAGLQGFAFRGRHSSEFGIILNSLKRSILAPLTEKTVVIPNREGVHYFGKQTGVREFKLDITISGTSADDLNAKIRDIAAWINSDDEEEIVFDKEADKSYFGFFTGTTDLQEVVTLGQTTLSFVCPDPYAYGPEQETTITTSPATISVGGKEDTYPEYKVKFTASTPYFTIGNKTQSIYIGANNAEKTLVAANAKVLSDGMASTSGWQAQSLVDDGVVTGSFSTANGWSFQAGSYGSGGNWHGPALKKMIATPIQDFRLTAQVGMYAASQKAMGRVELYLLDVNGNIIGKMALKDASGYEISAFEARAGNKASGKAFAYFTGSVAKQKKKVKVTKKVKGKNVTTYNTVLEQYGGVRDFAGEIFIERKGNKWRAGITKKDPKTGKAIWNYSSFRHTDSSNSYMTQVAGVAVHIAQMGTNPVMSPAYISTISLVNLKTVLDTEVQEIFDSTNELHINCEDGSVLLDGRPYMEDLNLSSEFFALVGNATNSLVFEPDDKCDVTISYRPRYL